jgi:hypothetical protein
MVGNVWDTDGALSTRKFLRPDEHQAKLIYKNGLGQELRCHLEADA